MDLLYINSVVAAPGCLSGQIISITGVTENTTYKGYRQLIKKYGGIHTEYISNRTTMLIYGSETEDGLPIETSTKWKEAQKENSKAAAQERGLKPGGGNLQMGVIDIMSEAEFYAWLEATATPAQRITFKSLTERTNKC
jgi:hypothetical protein